MYKQKSILKSLKAFLKAAEYWPPCSSVSLKNVQLLWEQS